MAGRSSYARRNSAFGVVEYLLYAFAIWKFVSDTYWGQVTKDANIFFGLAFIAIAFLLAVVRNYVVMQSIDADEQSVSESYEFVEVQNNFWSFFERIVRVSIIALVLLAPRYAYVPISNAVSESIAGFGHSVESWMMSIIPPWDSHEGHEGLHSVLVYDGAVLLSLALLSLSWDVVGLLSFGFSHSREKDILAADVDSSTVGDSVYRSLLMYMNLFKIRESNSKTRASFLILRRSEQIEEQVASGAVGYLYLKSPKFWERFCLALFALSVMACAITDFSIPAVTSMGVIVGVYFLAAAQNQRYFKDFVRAVFFPLWYIVRKGALVPLATRAWLKVKTAMMGA